MHADPFQFPARPRLRSIVARAATLATVFALLTVAMGCRQQPAADIPRHSPPASPAPKADARLTLANNNGRYHFEGMVADEATRQGLLHSLASVYGGDAEGTIAIDPNTSPPPWANRLGELFLAFRVPGGMLELRGNRVELSGAVPDEDRALLLKTARELYPDLALIGLFEGVDASQALPDANDGTELVALLNRIPISFQADSGLASSDSLDGLSRAARAIQGAAEGLRLQIGVHPERSDMPDYDRRIALQRANAVKVQLAIRGVGPGRLDAIALDDGAADKRGRVEFAVAATTAAVETGTDTPPRQDMPATP